MIKSTVLLLFLTIVAISCGGNELEDEVTIPDTLTSYFLGNEEDKVTNSKGGGL